MMRQEDITHNALWNHVILKTIGMKGMIEHRMMYVLWRANQLTLITESLELIPKIILHSKVVETVIDMEMEML